jgi:RNA polymerase sigma factor (sigma-70 family)
MANMTDTTATTGAPHPDAVAVADWLAGDRSALAVIYDRYGQSLFDTAAAMTGDRNDASDMVQDVFVLAAERLAQLRDPSRLKPWLFAILRNEVYRRSRRRSRTTTTDFGDPERDVMLPPTADHTTAVDDQIAHDDLAELVRGAARGLDQRDQLVLELSMRQGLSGDDLADALGVTAQQSYGLVHRMRERTERSLGAFCVARRGRRDCAELASILGNWDGEFSVLLRKRVARHIDACSTCERSRKKYAPLALIGAAPAFAAPLELRDLIVSSTPVPTPGGGGGTGLDTSTGFPRLLGSAARAVRTGIMITIGTAAGFAAVIGGGSILLDDGPDETTEAGARLVVVDTPESADQPGEQRVEVVVIDPTTTTIDAATTVPAPAATTPAVATAPPVVVVPADGPATPTTLASPATTTPPATTAPATTTPPPPPRLRPPRRRTPPRHRHLTRRSTPPLHQHPLRQHSPATSAASTSGST